MSDALDELIGVVPPPAVPVGAGAPALWARVEEALGVHLPRDYKAFIDTYGHGEFDDRFMIHSPFLPSGQIDASVEMQSLSTHSKPYDESQRNLRDAGFPAPYPLFPDDGGILCCASSSIGVGVYWVTSGASTAEPSWPVVYEDEGPWFREPGGVVSLLVQMLEGRVTEPESPLQGLFDRDRPRFVPLGS